MPISLIKKNQLDPNISDLVGQYGSGYFLPISVSGNLTGFIASALSNISGVELVNGKGGVINITGVSGVNVSNSGLNSIVIAYTGIPVPPNLVYTTGTQTVSGGKDFIGGLTISGNPVSTGTNNLSNNGYEVYLDRSGILNFQTSGMLGDTYGDGGVTLLSPSGKYSELASNDGNVYAWVADTDYGNPYGGGFGIGTNTTGDGYVWYFSNDGLFHFPDGSTQSGAYTGIDLSSYATNSNLELTGSSLSSSINSLSGTLTDIYATYAQLTGLSGYEDSITNLLATYDQLTGYSGFQATVDAAFATYSQLTGLSGYDAAVADLATTGSTLSSLINSLSGTLTQNYIIASQTGSFYPTNNPSGFITGVDLSSYTTLTGLQTGLSGIAQVAIAYSMLNAQIYTSGLSGYINNNFYPKNNPSGFITGVNLSAYTLNSNTGSFLNTSYQFGGDITGKSLSLAVSKIQGNPVSAQSPAAGQTLQWNGVSWIPGAIAAGGNGGGGLVYYFDFLNTNGILPTGGLSGGNFQNSLLAQTYSIASGSGKSADLSPQNTDVLIMGFITASGAPGVTNIPAGLWDFNIWADTDSNSATETAIKAVVNIYNPNTSTYRYLGSSDYVYLYDQTTTAQYLLNVTIPQTGIQSNERLYVQLFGQKSVNQSRTVTIYFDSYRPSHIHTTLPSVAGNGIVKVVNGVMQTPATGIFDSDIDANAQIQQSKIQGLVASLASLYPSSNPNNYITGVDLSSYTLKSQTGSFVTTAQTGAFYAASNPSGYVQASSASFTALPTVNGTGILLSGQAAALPSGIVYTTGNQNISGSKTFNNSLTLSNDITVSGTGIMNGGNIITGNATVTSIVYMTQAAYNAITPVSNILYIVV